ncbi:MAG: MBL fold metallo-hydrolase [Ruminococcus flavefaciens]|nr:MBL fold metallo-hydrolase [Ruminococcus flavefaciens]
MKILYMGTAAYEGVPSLFCNCRVCALSKRLGGRNVRSRSQALINGELLLDFNADAVRHYQQYSFDWEKICGCLITHSHCDHLYPDDMEIAAPWYTHRHKTINFYAAEAGYEKIKAVAVKTDGGIAANLIEAGKRFTVGGYSVLPLPANHEKATSPVIYSITYGGKRMLYAHDTGVFPEETRAGLKSEGYYNLISLDCTGCLGLNGDWRDGHMSLKTNLEMLEFMKREGLVDGKTVVVVNHFSHNGGQTYDEMLEEAAKHGVTVSYDGLEIEF